jgi:hypothetical protein
MKIRHTPDLVSTYQQTTLKSFGIVNYDSKGATFRLSSRRAGARDASSFTAAAGRFARMSTAGWCSVVHTDRDAYPPEDMRHRVLRVIAP